MPKFGRSSTERLDTCVDPLQRLFRRVVRDFDCTVVCGTRGRAEQDEAYNTGHSKIPWPMSNHNHAPSLAADVAPWDADNRRIPWEDTDRLYAFGWYVLGVAAGMGIPVRWGGDWDEDTDTTDQAFNDLTHFELVRGPGGGPDQA